MRFFFLEWVNDFEKMMLDSLAEEDHVFQINRIMRRFKSINKLLPGAYLKQLHKRIHCAHRFRAITEDDVIVCNGYSVFPFLDYVKTMRCRKILILRDTVEALTIKRRKLGQLAHNEDYIETVRPVFDTIFSFDSHDSEKYKLTYINQFLPFTCKQIQAFKDCPHSIRNSCFYVGGYETERVEYINSLTPILEKNGCETDFYLIDKYGFQDNYPANCKNQRLNYHENIIKLNAATFVLEINKPDQRGLTLRAVEAYAFNKRLITNNIAVKDHDFYNPSHFFIFDGKNEQALAEFLQQQPPPLPQDLLWSYSANGMLDTLKRHVA